MNQFRVTRRHNEFKVRILTQETVVEGSIVSVKEKPRLSDVINEAKPFLNVTGFEMYAKGDWLGGVGRERKAYLIERGDYIAVGKTMIEAIYVIPSSGAEPGPAAPTA